MHTGSWHDANKTMKNKGEIKMFEKMKELIAEQLNCPAEEIKMESSFKEDLGADSLDLFELVIPGRYLRCGNPIRRTGTADDG